jgi:FAD/FMN-containing dehydrogenase
MYVSSRKLVPPGDPPTIVFLSYGSSNIENNSCNPFLPKPAPCTLGNDVSYSVKVRDVTDIETTIAFASERNIRLVIRGTGHYYNGKSIGAGGLSVWTQDLTSMELIPSYYQGLHYSGRAAKVGAGIFILDVYKFADANYGIIVGGACPTVALAGGYTQGGGHGLLATKFGLTADQVLEWEVVTTTGQLLVASLVSNADLYWALCGGGGGTYGVVVSVTVKLHDPLPVALAALSFAALTTATGTQDFWFAVKTFIGLLPAMTDDGLHVI